MRKTISALLALIMCLSLCACGENTAATPAETEHVMTEEEVFAARILIEGAKSLPNPIKYKGNECLGMEMDCWRVCLHL